VTTTNGVARSNRRSQAASCDAAPPTGSNSSYTQSMRRPLMPPLAFIDTRKFS
jgi:hypothetical protein